MSADSPNPDDRPNRPKPRGSHQAKMLAGLASIRSRTPEELTAMRSRGGKRGGATTAAGFAELPAEERAERIRKLNEARLRKQQQLRARGESLWSPPPPELAVLGGKARMAQQTAGMTEEDRSAFFSERGKIGGKASGEARRPASPPPTAQQIAAMSPRQRAAFYAEAWRKSGQTFKGKPGRPRKHPETRADERARQEGTPGSALNEGESPATAASPAREPAERKRRARRPDSSRGVLAQGSAPAPAELGGGALCEPVPAAEVLPPADAVAIADARQAQAVVEERRDELRIKLPFSGLRSERNAFCRLLQSMRPDPESGFDFVGQDFTSGKLVTGRELRPNKAWPDLPLVLEFAGVGTAEGPGHTPPRGSRRNPRWYILWRLNGAKWEEVTRTSATGLEWTRIIAPAVEAALAPPVASEEMIHAMCFKMLRLFDRWALRQTPENRRLMVQLMHDEIAGRAVQWS